MILKLVAYTVLQATWVATIGSAYIHWMESSWLWFLAGLVSLPFICVSSAMVFQTTWQRFPAFIRTIMQHLESRKVQSIPRGVEHGKLQVAYCPVDNRRDNRKNLRRR